MTSSRRSWLLTILATLSLFLLACGGGPSTRLKTVKSPTGDGDLELRVLNASDAGVNNLYIADTKKVSGSNWARMEPGSPDEAKLWGNDLLSAAIAPGEEAPLDGIAPGRWDFRIVDRDGREQHITGVKLGAGGKYVLELYESGWRVRE